MVMLAVVVKASDKNDAEETTERVVQKHLTDLDEPAPDRFHDDLHAYAYGGGFSRVLSPTAEITAPEQTNDLISQPKPNSKAYNLVTDPVGKQCLESPEPAYVFDAVSGFDNPSPTPTPLSRNTTGTVLEYATEDEYVTYLLAR